MGTYYPTSNNQRDAATMLYLRDPLPSSYSETPVHTGNMMMYMNFASSSSGGSYSDALGASNSNNTSQQEVLLNFGGSRNEEMLLIGENSGVGAPNSQGQGLSLSLGTHVPSVMQLSPNIQYQGENPSFSSIMDHNTSISAENSYQAKQTRDNNNEYMLARGVPNSKYLKAAQQLLDEVVNVKKATKDQNGKKELMKDSKDVDGELGASSGTPKASENCLSELSVAEKQELQNKMTKLLSMLDEVDRRYRQYYHQMQIVVSSFDVVAGSGAAKPYTSLALQTISRHFRCLRDAINDQIQAAKKSLGEEDASLNDNNNKGVGISRLRYVDQQLKQQRALQQLGMMQNHAWRPQRGLPETSVSILRAWLFEHFLHPYPKDSDKTMLARQTGLTRSQVSNWFINARVRLWKPMVEEMYKEEAGDADVDSNSSSETLSKALKTRTKASEEKGEQQSVTSIGQNPDIEMVGPDTNSIFHNSPQTEYGMIGKTREGQNSTFADALLQSNFGGERFMADTAEYHEQISEMERFGNVSGISLTLGLQQCEGGTIGMADGTHHHGFVPMRGNDVYNNSSFGYGD